MELRRVELLTSAVRLQRMGAISNWRSISYVIAEKPCVDIVYNGALETEPVERLFSALQPPRPSPLPAACWLAAGLVSEGQKPIHY